MSLLTLEPAGLQAMETHLQSRSAEVAIQAIPSTDSAVAGGFTAVGTEDAALLAKLVLGL